MTPQHVELTHWVVFSPSPSRHPPHQPPTCRIDMLGVFLVALPSVPTPSTPNVSFRYVGGFPHRSALGIRPIDPPTCQFDTLGFSSSALVAHPIDPQRVLLTRWGLSLSAEVSTPAPMTPQRVELTRWGFHHRSALVAHPIDPQRVKKTRWGLSLSAKVLTTTPMTPPTCRIDTLGVFLDTLPSVPTPLSPNVSKQHFGGFHYQ